MTNETVPVPDPLDAAAPDAAEAPKPKRARRAKPAEAEGVQVPAEDASAAPARKTSRARKAVAVDSSEAALPVGDSALTGDSEPAPAKRAPRRRKPVAESSADAASGAPGLATEAAPEEAASQGNASAAAGDAVVPSADEVVVREATPQGVLELGDELPELVERRPRGEPRRPAPEGALGAMEGVEAGEGSELRPSRRAAMAQQQASEVFDELFSGDFDKQRDEVTEESASEEGAAYKRVLRPEPDAPKLQKVLAQAGVGSRRDIELMIEEGRIEVNDQVAHIGQRISFGDRVKVAGKPIKVRIQPPAARILAYHKPVGEVVTHDDPQGRPTVFRRLPKLMNGKWMSVGRLDLNTEGLLLFTNSGELANQLMHPRFGVEREYAVRVLGSLDDAARERLLTGVEIEGQAASFVSISNGLGEGVNQWYRVVITEGRNREVRKLFDAVGLTVNRLIRVRYGAIVLPRGLRRGVWVELGESDVRAVKSLAGMDRQDLEGGRGKGKHKGQGGQQGRQANASGQGGGSAQGQGQAQGRHQGKSGRGGQPQGNRGPQQGQAGPRGPQQRQQDRQPVHQHSHDGDDDLDHIGPIPNPLEQTFDRRFAKGSKRIVAGFGRPDQDHGMAQQAKQKGPRQPDPMQTSVGYIGADAFFGGGRGGAGRRNNKGRR